jgi:hypothetical protein
VIFTALRDRTQHGRAGLLAPTLSTWRYSPMCVEGDSPNFAMK